MRAGYIYRNCYSLELKDGGLRPTRSPSPIGDAAAWTWAPETFDLEALIVCPTAKHNTFPSRFQLLFKAEVPACREGMKALASTL